MQEFKLVLGAVAGAFEAAVTLPRNCFFVKDESMNHRYCNAPLVIAAYTESLEKLPPCTVIITMLSSAQVLTCASI